MLQPQDITKHFIDSYIKCGDTAVDATAGNGNDTLKLCNAVGENGFVYAFDIQDIAVEQTKKLLTENGFSNFNTIKDSHSNLDTYVTKPVKAVIFNLGYLPGGDHNIHTQYDTTIKAIEKSLSVTKPDGFVAIAIYHGKNSGTEERDKVLEYIKKLDYKKYTAVVHDFYNRPNNPPITVVITHNIK